MKRLENIIEKRNKINVPPVYSNIWTTPKRFEPTTIKIKAIRKRVIPKKKVERIIFELRHVVRAVPIDNKQNK